MKVVITGASKGIGRATAELFAKNGHDLFICSRGEVALYKAMEELMTRYPTVTVKAKAFDLAVREQAIEFGNWCLGYGVPDIVINNAGLFEPGTVQGEAEGVLESQMATNLYSAYHVTRSLLPAMIREKRGHIFNLCSVASIGPYPNGGAYSISKFAQYGFHKNLREELKSTGIKVTAIIAGAVMTDSWAGFDNRDQRIMDPADIAQLIFVTSQLSPSACVEEILVRPQLGDLE